MWLLLVIIIVIILCCQIKVVEDEKNRAGTELDDVKKKLTDQTTAQTKAQENVKTLNIEKVIIMRCHETLHRPKILVFSL